ncbi:2-octaprenyl-6-methoxyphenyl hydroxylase [Colwellia sp. E2M01]|uniref:2-octaprenyl-6-methoxyphenyl hydroxylase n=1 Tax=Colwellia sp. E2M01 TaxID=2841561 RepID=UPI001C09ED90|nr:2-octaprenyl-6-methoxyphenyl hydroxylase [Colwellia sp. E2M01]MBU2869424.1 2-octaprenyl-6-methoxyphenyl hydroxylase [Colwellia sp. E2M01]
MTTTKNTNQHFDVIISGSGLSGSLMALSLSKLTKQDGSLLSIAIIEMQTVSKSKLNNDSSLFDERVLALSHGSAKYLNELGAWHYLKSDACAITDIDISDRGHFGKARLAAKEHNVNALGYVVAMEKIGKAQLNALKNSQADNTKADNTKANNTQADNIQWFSPDSISAIDWHTENANQAQVRVTLNSNKILSASLILACDGVQSPVRKLANIKVNAENYQQVALITNVSTSKHHQNKAFERFTEFGPIAMLPLTNAVVNSSGNSTDSNRCSLVWTMTPEQGKVINQLDDTAFKTELERAFGSYLGTITQVGKRHTYPLVLLQAQQQTYHRMALVGNSSHTIHPIAGQGFNLGLRDVKVMAKLIEEALLANQDIGSFSLLQTYQTNRAKDQRDVIALTDSLVTLFANDLPPLVLGRNIALQGLNFMSPLKNALVKKTMGY